MILRRQLVRLGLGVRRYSGRPNLEPAHKIELEAKIKAYAQMPQKQIHLDDLLKYKVPLSEELLLQNAVETLHNVTVRLAHRLDALRYLDYLIVLNPNISQIYSLYFNSFRVISSTPPPKTAEDNARFVQVLDQLVEGHKNTIPTLAKGFYEARRYISTAESAKFLDKHLRARIGTRLIASHHIALTNPIADNFIGAVETNCSPARTLHECAEFVGEICDLKYGIVPHIVIDQGESVELPYIPVHMEYIFTELLKNSFRATIENNAATTPILCTVVKTGNGVMIRIRDRGGGIDPEMEQKVFGFAFSTFEEAEGDGFSTLNSPPGGGGSSIAGLGYGLPLSRAYAEFFGGKLQIQSYYGWGTDVYISLKSVPLKRD
ncbi:[Pyruvate dehydrogenase (acetyl-transferring)] kinase 1, mitochondrial [Trichomonascus vanleenenianus]|uniref:alpha-ketoacid dehydrogenase kinase family protein n=1 Tax=Trichomonascus vanleenenianus TaxID=2268995 RepID=UPI003ECA2E8D